MLVAVTIWILPRYRRTVHISRSAADIFWFLSCALRFWFSCHASLEKLASEVEVPLGIETLYLGVVPFRNESAFFKNL